jgi:hypothetical protein
MGFFIKACNDRTNLREYLARYVYSWEGYDDYVRLIGPDKVKILEADPARVLAAPLREGILPDGKVRELLAEAKTEKTEER